MSMEYNFIATLRTAYEYRHEPEHMRVLAETLWRVLLVLALFSAIGWIWFGLTELANVLDRSDAGSSAAAGSLPLDKAQLEAVLQAFATRQERSQALLATPAEVSDPAVSR
jgi:hypothetical protein